MSLQLLKNLNGQKGTCLFSGVQLDSGKNFLESVEEDFKVIDFPGVCSESVDYRSVSARVR